jgi:competence protein ComEC
MKKILLVMIIGLILVGRYFWYKKNHTSHIPERWFENKTEIIGIVTEDPDRGLEKTKIVLGDLGILVTLPSAVNVSYGDMVSVFGKVDHPENFTTATNREFDYKNYLAVHDVYGLLRANDLKIISHDNGSLIYKYLFTIKKYFVGIIKNIFPQKEAGLFAGIMVGEKSLLPKETLNDFQIAGLTHMIVLSGHNITLVTIAITTMLAWFGMGYRARRLGAIAIIPVFLIMTGLGASSLRAGIMAIIALLLQITTRPAHAFRIIVYTICIIGWMNPRTLLYDPGFHLSLLAFIGLVFIAPIAERWTEGMPELFGIGSLIVETTAVQLFVLPYILWMSGQISLLILISNILVVPLTSFIMSGGFLATLLGMVSYPLGSFLAWPIQKLLSYTIWIAHIIGSVSQAVITIPPFGGWVVLLFYGVIMVYLIRHL